MRLMKSGFMKNMDNETGTRFWEMGTQTIFYLKIGLDQFL